MSRGQVIINQHPGKEFSEIIASVNPSKIAVIVDENTKEHCYPIVSDLIPAHIIIEIKSGEEEKTLQTCTAIWQQMTDEGFDRKGLVINLGGGVIGDMGGFCASTYKRGVEFIQVPTTLLSMVDASAGGKLGIDFNAFKNHIGVFNLPYRVMVYTQFLDTLPFEELRSGYAEVIKHCLIADADKWNEIKQVKFPNHDWKSIVAHSVKIKEKITTEDPTEKGLRKILNFGHTLGHAIESFYLNTPNKLLHGEAISIGMVIEAYMTKEKGFISDADLEEITAYTLESFGKLTYFEKDIEEILGLTIQDKKNEHNKVKFSLLEKIGTANYNIDATKEEMEAALRFYLEL